ncbi:MAG: Nicotinamide-nucleotide adenylyltransferase [Microgenomates group bacterium GW2011_GWB1_46_7]|nr:MAG: Nicotinamide-nucleotide adenylyltransferase [Microgenomates group bacterium GW2011_GWB1_46_7]
MKQYQEVLFIGRFQPLHLGHLDCMEHALSTSERVTVVIGSINLVDELANPWTYAQRRQMWERVIVERGWGERVRIVGVNDYMDDDEKWAKEILVQAPEAEAVYGHNQWTNDTLAKYGGLVVEEPGLVRREELEGTLIRAIMREGKDGWEERVPTELHELLRGWSLNQA